LRPVSEGDEERELMWSWNALWSALLASLRRLRPARRKRSAVLADTAIAAERDPDSMRALYQTILRWCHQRGRPRLPFETPAEFEAKLTDYLPASLSDALTAAYAQARYGEQAVPDSDVDDLAAQWQAQRSTGLR